MITKKTAANIYAAHLEIENSQKILAELKENVLKNEGAINLRDLYGNAQGLQLHLPTDGFHSFKLFNVQPGSALRVIEQHVKDNQQRLEELMAIAEIELKG